MNTNRRVAALVVLTVSVAAFAGDLNPPAGMVAPSMKPLTEVEPRIAINATNTPGDADSLFKITQRGSYYLTGNITGVAGKHGIEIVASGVTVDLNGFDLAGAAGSGSLAGVIVTEAGVQNIAVINGSVRDWGTWGVDLFTLSAQNCRVADLLASDNGTNGISLGTAGTIANCSANSNTGHGIIAGNATMVTNCSAYANTGKGIQVSEGCTVTNCTSQGNSGIGIEAGHGCDVKHCSVYLSGADGIKVDQGSTVANCSARGNAGSGITHNGVGTISNCSGLSNTGNGILLISAGCSVSNCCVAGNTLNGITAPGASNISGCSAILNTLDGIRCTGTSIILSNTCSSNGFSGDGAGIHVTHSDNRIEGNNCSGADRGIEVGSPGNTIIRNTCAGNTTDWAIAANNVVGPILDRRAPVSNSINGFSAPDSTGSTHPNANFSY